MKIDPRQSIYHEDPLARTREEFSRVEIKHCRVLLRRLRFLEAKARETGGIADSNGNGGAVFAEVEIEALVWTLNELGFLAKIQDHVTSV